jgi:hypothetical protein
MAAAKAILMAMVATETAVVMEMVVAMAVSNRRL